MRCRMCTIVCPWVLLLLSLLQHSETRQALTSPDWLAHIPVSHLLCTSVRTRVRVLRELAADGGGLDGAARLRQRGRKTAVRNCETVWVGSEEKNFLFPISSLLPRKVERVHQGRGSEAVECICSDIWKTMGRDRGIEAHGSNVPRECPVVL